mmetsp:Transcript_61/g.104  ORF Transcript_61/g.104 Transcript_61/m.104 type:complete len:86 (-) Transcript_61:89-346(-)
MTTPAIFALEDIENVADGKGGRQYIVAGADDASRSACVWDSSHNHPIQRLTAHPDHILDVAAEPSNALLGSLSDSLCTIYKSILS